MPVCKSITFLFVTCLLINAAAAQGGKPGKWAGWIKQGETAYTYTLQINKVSGDSLFGTSTSRSRDFFCETKFRGVQQKGKWSVVETVVNRTNYTGVGTVCLMRLSLTKTGERLQGTFTSSSKELKDCGSGTVALQFIPEPVVIVAEDSSEQISEVKSPRQSTPVATMREQQEPKTLIQEKKVPVIANRVLEKRQIELLNTFTFDEDSIMLRLYDNGVIDGDVITLVINGRIVLDKVKLSAQAIELPLIATTSYSFQVEFFAENLGEIPPNTGLVVLSGNSRQSEVVFSSNLQKTSAFRVILREKE